MDATALAEGVGVVENLRPLALDGHKTEAIRVGGFDLAEDAALLHQSVGT